MNGRLLSFVMLLVIVALAVWVMSGLMGCTLNVHLLGKYYDGEQDNGKTIEITGRPEVEPGHDRPRTLGDLLSTGVGDGGDGDDDRDAAGDVDGR